jgi:hypothetical protein
VDLLDVLGLRRGVVDNNCVGHLRNVTEVCGRVLGAVEIGLEHYYFVAFSLDEPVVSDLAIKATMVCAAVTTALLAELFEGMVGW